MSRLQEHHGQIGLARRAEQAPQLTQHRRQRSERHAALRRPPQVVAHLVGCAYRCRVVVHGWSLRQKPRQVLMQLRTRNELSNSCESGPPGIAVCAKMLRCRVYWQPQAQTRLGTSAEGYASSAPNTSAAASGRMRAPSQRSRSGSDGGVKSVNLGAAVPLPAVIAATSPLCVTPVRYRKSPLCGEASSESVARRALAMVNICTEHLVGTMRVS